MTPHLSQVHPASIETHGLTVGYAANAVLRDVNLRIFSGSATAIVGANGAGKTTLLRSIAGLHAAIAGRSMLNGQDVFSMAVSERARLLSFVDADQAVYGEPKVVEIVSMGRFAFRAWWQWTSHIDDAAAIDEGMRLAGVAQFRERRFSTLSSGERQCVWIAVALAAGAPVILLDEPTSRLDLRHAFEVLALLRRLSDAGKTILVSMHDLERAASFADRVIMLADGGVLASGTPREVFTPALLAQAYGVAVQVRADEQRLWLHIDGPVV